VLRSATISADGRFRYRLRRQWGPGGRTLPWVMLNPSTADAVADDPTIRRVIRFSRDWGYDGCDVVNLFAFRSADVGGLLSADDPVGPRNVRAVTSAIADSAATGCDRVVVAWGLLGARLLAVGLGSAGARRVAAAAAGEWEAAGMTAVRLGATATGAPRHPLYVAAAARPEPLPRGSIRAPTGTTRARGGAARR
jgi:hypothetical protein